MDLAAIKLKLKALEEGKPKSKKWKPKAEHTVRCLPLPGELAHEDIAYVIKWHYGVDNGKQIACPSTWGDACPFCDLAASLKSWNDEKGREKSEAVRKMDWEWFKKIDAAVKHYIPIGERRKDSSVVDGPFLWELTPKTYQAVLKIVTDDDYNSDHEDGGGFRILTSLAHGRDLTVTLKKAGQDGNKTTYDLTEVKERKKASPLFKDDEAQARAFIGKIPPLSSISEPVTTEQAERVFATWKANLESAPAETGDAGVEYHGNSGERPATGGSEVNDAVAKLEALLAKPA